MRTVTVGIAILGFGILAALPFRHRGDPDAPPDAAAAAVMNRPSVAPLEEVPLEQFAQQQYWPVAAQRSSVDAGSSRSGLTSWPQLPASYTDVAIPLATPQVIAQRYSATAPLRADPQRPLAAVASSTAAASDGHEPGWQRGLPLGQPLRGSAAFAQLPAPMGATAAAAAEYGDVALQDRPASAGGYTAPWPSPEELARAAQLSATAAGDTADQREPVAQGGEALDEPVASARPGRSAVTAVSATLRPSAAVDAQPSTAQETRQRLYIREPARSRPISDAEGRQH